MVDRHLEGALEAWQSGSPDAENQLYQLAYQHLRTLASQERHRIAGKFGDDNTVLQDCVNSTTALLHDAYLKLSVSDKQDIKHSRHFYLMATKIMRQILFDQARHLRAKKRQHTVPNQDKTEIDLLSLTTMDKALDKLEVRYPRQANAIKLKYLMGMKNDEISQLLECSASLIDKDLRFARSWLQLQVSQ
ncbi:ECF-type sigma factor [Photobacterium lipolyticum]|uniref:RNA polymerase subunit sigma n=1 Tax=Photobacterium lipolyticum TaxID=266810 RepID=A0A2T3N2X1_9GAMM|nr:ECF-type sigma factor [Photobacterium lipolyticum]PSW06719.1 RNA polymerase subunit sigma [Photobacterium lipolyticum]